MYRYMWGINGDVGCVGISWGLYCDVSRVGICGELMRCRLLCN